MNAPSIFCNECGAANALQATYCFGCNKPLHAPAPSSPAQIQAVSSHAVGAVNKINTPLAPSYLLHSRHSIVSQVGTGGFGAVYQAKDTLFGHRPVAIKEMSQDGLSPQEQAEATAAFEHEALMLADLVHPNVPRIYDYFVENHRWYFVMDLLDGERLSAYLESTPYRSLPTEEVIDIGLQLATVLDYLHIRQSPLGFKDLTLDTLWRTPDGKLYLLDTGTVPAAAIMPESLSIASLGKVLRQLRTGKRAARSRLRIALPPRLRKQPRPPKQAQSVPLDLLLRTMAHRDATKRPSNMGMVRQELQHLATQQMLATSRKRRIFSRRTFLILGGLTGLAELGVASSWMTDRVAFQWGRQVPHPEYSPTMGGTIYTYNAGSEVDAVAWSPDGQHIASGGKDSTVQVWPVRLFESNGQQQSSAMITYRGHTAAVQTVAWSPDSRIIASAAENVQLWNGFTGRHIFVYTGNDISAVKQVIGLAWSPNGRYIASGGMEGTVQVWNATRVKGTEGGDVTGNQA